MNFDQTRRLLRIEAAIRIDCLRLLLADAVEKVGCWQKRTLALRLNERGQRPSSYRGLRERVEFGELSEVLGCCCEVELVSCAVGTA